MVRLPELVSLSDFPRSEPGPGTGTDFVATPNGDAIPVPKGGQGPFPATTPGGQQYNGGARGNGLAPNVTDLRIMAPDSRNPGGYVNYSARQANGGWQSVDPYSALNDPAWHSRAYPHENVNRYPRRVHFRLE